MTSVLLLVDVQRNMLEPPGPVPDATAVAAAIDVVLNRARSAGAPVIHIRNNGGAGDPDAPGTPGWELVHPVLSGEHSVDKRQPDSFDGTGLDDLIPASTEVVVAGMQSEYCVRETCLAALQRGHRVVLVQDAHATYDGDTPAKETSQRIEEELVAAGVKLAGSADVAFA